MTPEAMARLHGQCFPHAPWTEGEIARMLALPTTLAITRPHGFILAQVVPPEAEVLTLAVDPGKRRRGIGRDLLARLEAALLAEGCTRLMLEVASDTPGAQALYAAAGFTEKGRRRGYYARAGSRADAVLMERSFGPAATA